MSDDSRRVRFGSFELDLRSGDLWRAGKRRTLQEQPLAVLKALLEHPGEVVTREDLCRPLWPDGTFVDFEHGLNAAIKRLRDSLGTDAEAAGLIETVPRRGYRFTAAVEPVVDATAPAPLSPPPPHAGSKSWQMAVASIALLLPVGAVAFSVWRPVKPVAAASEARRPSPHELTQVTYDSGWTTQPTVSPDGQFLAYASDRGSDNLTIWLQRTDGGEPRQLTHQSANDHEPAFSPDGSRIVFRSERNGGGLYTIPAHSGGRETLLVTGGHDPRYSPDGRHIVYWTGAPQTDTCDPKVNGVYIVPADGGHPTPIAVPPSGACWPIWAPDSRHLLVTVLLKEVGLRWLVVSIEGGAPVDSGLSDLAGRQRFMCPARQQLWQGNRLVFGVWREGPMNLWECQISSSTWRVEGDVEQLTTGPEHQMAASMTADGRLLFASHSNRAAIWSLPVAVEDGRVRGAPRRLTEGVQMDRMPTVSLDGSIAFTRNVAEQEAVYLLDSKTDVQTLKVPNGPDILFPSISGDGSRIAYWHKGGIEAVGARGTEAERLTVCGGVCLPEGWSSDNGSLLYVDQPGGEARIFALRLTTGGKRLLAARPGHALYQARFSPDGLWLSFMDYVGDRSSVWVAPIPPTGPIERATWIEVAPGDSYNDKPRWSPAGGLLYYLSDRDGFRCIWAQRLDPESRRPIGSAFAVFHVHDASQSISNVLVENTGFDVARDQLIFNMGQRAGNVWTTRLDPKQ